ncbi:MAG: N,N-dimethylformamidase beta subunit family domain-containing protein [Gaiellaceae bacterium]
MRFVAGSPARNGGLLEERFSRRRFVQGAVAVVGVVLIGPGRMKMFGGVETDPPNTVVAGFPARSYRAGDVAELAVHTPARKLALEFFQAGPERRRAPSGMGGVRVTSRREIDWHGGSGVVQLGIERWPTGLYFVRLHDDEGRSGYAPFVLRPHDADLGRARVLVVLPTNTWGAYNFRDAATWYANPDVTQVDLTRPYLGGVPPHYRGYDMGFLRWFAGHGKQADFFADDDLESVPSGEELARRYRLIVFSGHEEYVTEHTYDIVQRFQKLGGNLMFLSANNFFYKVEKQGNLMNGRWRWRDLGRPEARMIGAQYLDWYQDVYPNRPLTVTGAHRAPWLFERTGFGNGSRFGTYGIEIDALSPDSPEGVEVLAEIPHIFGPGQTAQMTHYTAPNGAEVFDAGVLNFGGTADDPGVSTMIENLWQRLGPGNET